MHLKFCCAVQRLYITTLKEGIEYNLTCNNIAQRIFIYLVKPTLSTFYFHLKMFSSNIQLDEYKSLKNTLIYNMYNNFYMITLDKLDRHTLNVKINHIQHKEI
jgi:hypothetical protein